MARMMVSSMLAVGQAAFEMRKFSGELGVLSRPG